MILVSPGLNFSFVFLSLGFCFVPHLIPKHSSDSYFRTSVSDHASAHESEAQHTAFDLFA